MDVVERVGRWLVPAPALGVDAGRVQRRAGVLGMLVLGAVIGVALGSTLSVVVHPTAIALVTGPGVPLMVAIAVAFVLALVLLPPAVLRTRSRAQTERLLASPTARLRSWSRTTMAIDLMPAAVMVATVYFAPDFMLAVLAAALLVRAAVRTRRQRDNDPDAAYVAILGSGAALAEVGVIVATIGPLSAQVLADPGPIPFLLAAAAVVLVDVAAAAADRWVRMDDSPWAFVRDLLDPRRWITSTALAATAWLAVWVAEAITRSGIDSSADLGSAACLTILVLAWILVRLGAVIAWKVEARRIIRRWAAHQGRVLTALQAGALDTELAARAATAVTGRMAVTIFGAEAVVLCLGDGSRVTIGVDDCRIVDAAELVALPHRRIRVAAGALDPAVAEVLVVAANAPGRVALRSRDLRAEFTTLALATLIAPQLPAQGRTAAFDATHEAMAQETTQLLLDVPPVVSPGSLRDDLIAAARAHEVDAVAASVLDLHERDEQGLMVGLSWDYRIGGADLRRPTAFLAAVQESVPVAAVAAELLRDAAIEAVGLVDTPVVVPMPACLLAPEAGVHALPNIVGAVDRSTAMRIVLAFTDLPSGSGQALRVLDDLGFRIAVSDACTAADRADLAGWRRWAVLFDLDATPDPLHVQQVLAAIATSDTTAVGLVSGPVEPALLASCELAWIVDLRRPAAVGAP